MRPHPDFWPAAMELSVEARRARVAAAVEAAAKPVALILRGISGAGKTTLARQIGGPVVEADDAFVGPDGYLFDPRRLTEAHAGCFRRWCGYLASAAERRAPVVAIVANTAITAEEVSPYVLAAQAWGVAPLIVRLSASPSVAASRSTHGVSRRRIEDAAMRLREPLPAFLAPLEIVLP